MVFKNKKGGVDIMQRHKIWLIMGALLLAILLGLAIMKISKMFVLG